MNDGSDAAPPTNRDDDSARFIAEVLRLNDRFTREVVERFNICPYARGARMNGTAIREVLLQRDLDPEPTLALIARLESDTRGLDVVQVIYPRIEITPREFEHFNAGIRDRYAERVRPERAAFVHAAFHPAYPCDRRSPDALVSFFRRAPDPTIQLVRFAAIQSVRKDADRGTVVYDPATFDWTRPPDPPPLTVPQRITRDNHALIERQGPDEIEAIYQSIRVDRDGTYARFASLL